MASYKKKENKRIKLEGKDRHGKTKSVRKTFLADDIKRKTEEGSHEVLLIDTPEYQDKVERTYEYIKQGMRHQEIYAMMLAEDPEMTPGKFTGLIKYAYQYAENALHKDREFVFQLHMDRYEKMYEQSIIMTTFWGQPLERKKDWAIMVARYSNAIKALHSKEDLLGLHDKSVVIEYHDQKATVLEKEMLGGRDGIPGYNLDNLTLAEKVELLAIIKESRTVPIQGIQRVTIKTLKIEINSETGERRQFYETKNIEDIQTHEVKFEDMPDDVVSTMKKEYDEAEVVEESGIVVTDHRPKNVVNSNLSNVKDKINVNILDSFKKKLNKK